MKITASAPTKVILTGEHYVVHGAPAITVALDARNSVTLDVQEGKPEVVIEGSIGSNKWEPGTEVQGMLFKAFLEMAKHIFEERHVNFATYGKKLHLTIHYSGMPKGCGNSASIASAVAMAIYKLLNHTPSTDEIFHTVQVAEKVAHGAPSGIDARTCGTGRAQRFQKSWNAAGEVSFKFEDTVVEFPKTTVLLLVTSKIPPHEAQPTGELVATFAQTKLGKKLADVTREDRQKLIHEFQPVYDAFTRNLRVDAKPLDLAKAWQDNNDLLANGGVVPQEMQERIEWALQAGALAAKGTGAAGRGGTIILLAYKDDVHKITYALKQHGLDVLAPTTATHGAHVDKVE